MLVQLNLSCTGASYVRYVDSVDQVYAWDGPRTGCARVDLSRALEPGCHASPKARAFHCHCHRPFRVTRGRERENFEHILYVRAQRCHPRRTHHTCYERLLTNGQVTTCPRTQPRIVSLSMLHLILYSYSLGFSSIPRPASCFRHSPPFLGDHNTHESSTRERVPASVHTLKV